MLLDTIEDPHEPFLGDDDGIPIHKEDPFYSLHIFRGKEDVGQNGVVILDPEPLLLIGPAEGTPVMGTPYGYLEQDAVGLAGWPNAVPLVVHALAFKRKFHTFSFS